MFLKWGQSDQSVPIGSNYFFLQGLFLNFSKQITPQQDIGKARQKQEFEINIPNIHFLF